MTHLVVRRLAILVLGVASLSFLAAHAQTSSSSLGIFEGQSDVGAVTPPGAAVYDPATSAYTLTSAGANLWGTTDGFHFLWKKASGDVSLTADIDFPDTTGEHSPHRKAILIVRQTLDADSAYADAASHGSGEAALQDRRIAGGITEGIELDSAAPRRLRLEKRGDTFTLYLASSPNAPLHQVGASTQLHLEEPFYVGIGLCSHDVNRVEKAVFTHVTLEKPAPLPATLALYSTLQTIGDDQDFHRVAIVSSTQGHMEAPNWTHDGKTIIFDEAGKIMTVSADGGTPQPLDIGDATGCNGSHGLSPDGQSLAISCTTPGKPESRVYIVPLTGGAPRLVTEHPNSYWHSWSPDGKPSSSPAPITAPATSSPSPSTAAKNTRSPPAPASATILTARPMASTSTSIPTAPAACRSGACILTAARPNRSPTTTTSTGRPTSPPTANPWSSSATRREPPAIPPTGPSRCASCHSKIEKSASFSISSAAQAP